MIAIYGLGSCDTCRKARKWLDREGIAHQFRDVRSDGLDGATLDAWVAALGWEALLNRRGTTWRGLLDADRDGVGAGRARALMLAHPALVKRPVFDLGGGRFLLGFGDDQRAALTAAG
jgi:Spx/MgsR family transcriptional regulator